MWTLILTIISAVLFFGFVVLGVVKFRLLDCYSAYGPMWAKTPPFSWQFSPWMLVTGGTAALLIPVMLEASIGSVWQFTGFLCPVLLLFVALTPDYGKSKTAEIVHVIGARGAALWAVAYILFNATHLWWLIVLYLALAGLAILYYGKWCWGFWSEMAAYCAIYTTMFILTYSPG